MKIVHCVFSFNTGGAEMLIVDLINELCDEHDVSLVIVNSKWSESLMLQINKRAKIYFINRKEGSRNPFPILRLNFLLNKIDPDIIHCHDAQMGNLIRLPNAKLVFTFHTIGIPANNLHRYDLLIAISDAVKSDIATRVVRNSKTIYNGIHINSFKRRSDYRLGEGNPFSLVQVGRLDHEIKGQDILLEALALLKADLLVPVRLDFVGDGPSCKYLKELTKRLNLEQEVHFQGNREKQWLYQHLSDFNVLVQPSRIEGFGLTVLEGVAAGLPVLVSSGGGPDEILRRNYSGFSFENGQPDNCAKQLKLMYAMYKEGQMNEFMLKGKQIVETEYIIKRCAERHIQEYTELLTT
ncbi:glycosyltransferase family 4 protein [Pontibacter burrus]|uniref:Glycosyltransferase family 4 protein n=1 Tax=Pontibacter burrus TaxID=2704466 RepID=A0A6B3LRR6_9BACT|nr:glycosyltransferase family 4 protein [Pontibacter burrus]NEM97745.1 glycosyltransferase family 4 protein [Pontibacter burrus]